jgi:hypothetical protein
MGLVPHLVPAKDHSWDFPWALVKEKALDEALASG